MVAGKSQEQTGGSCEFSTDAGVLAASIAVASSITFGIDVTLRAGGGCYLLLLPAALGMGIRGPQPAR